MNCNQGANKNFRAFKVLIRDFGFGDSLRSVPFVWVWHTSMYFDEISGLTSACILASIPYGWITINLAR